MVVIKLQATSNKKQDSETVKTRRLRDLQNPHLTSPLEKGEELNIEDSLCLLVHLKMTGQLIFVPNEDDPPSPRLRKDEAGQLIFQPRAEKEVRSKKYESPSPSSSPSGRGRINTLSKSVMDMGRIYGGHPSRDWVGELPSKHTRIMIFFEDGSTLYFNDMRVFGWMKLAQQSTFNKQLATMPPDVVDDEFTSKYLASQLKRSGRAIKLVILDQQMMGGMGNIYANDALWWAGVKPTKPANKLRKGEIKALHGAMVRVLARGIETGGATISDYRQTDGMGGRYQDETPTYFRDGELCLREECGGVIEKFKLGGRGTYWCRGCQK